MNLSAVEHPISGSVLTCFTSAIATYLNRYGLDYRFAFGLQLYLAIKVEEHGGLKTSFVYLHRPLVGSSPLFSLHLARCWTNDRDGAHERLLREWRNKGHLIVSSDSYNLPWQINYGKKHAPHCFLVEEIDEAMQMVRICDPFEYAGVYGTQAPYNGWVPLFRLADLAKPYCDPSHLYLKRDRYGFGIEEQVPLEAYQGYQWFEAIQRTEVYDYSPAHLIGELIRTYRQMIGTEKREDLVLHGWQTGLEAIAALPTLFEKHLTNPELYELGDDLWAVCRHRQLFAYSLRHLANMLSRPQLRVLADWCDETLVALWSGIPRLMIYNASCLQRYRAPRDLLIEQVKEAYQAEVECVRRLGTYLSQIEGVDIEYAAPSSDGVMTRHCEEGVFIFDSKNTEEVFREQRDNLVEPHRAGTQQEDLPSNDLEELLLDIWTGVLEKEDIGIFDNFFEIGGNSLTAMQVLSRLDHSLQVEITLQTFLENPTIANLALLLEEMLLEEIENPSE